MKNFFLSLLVLLICSWCLAYRAEGAEKAPSTQPTMGYPYGEVENAYIKIFENLTGKYYSLSTAVDLAHTAKMREYVAKTYTQEQFMKEAMTAPNDGLFERASRDEKYGESDEFKAVLKKVVSEAKNKANLGVRRAMYVYTAKEVDRKPALVPPLESAKTMDELNTISWISGEVTVNEAAKASKSYTPAPGDTAYRFMSGGNTWTNLMGRAGFVVVRDGKILEIIVTMLN